MLRKKNRLSRAYFRSVSSGRAFQSEFMTLRLAKGSGESRFSIVVPSSVAKKASDRNHLRRLLYALLQSQWQNLKKGLNGAIFLKKGAAAQDARDLKGELLELLSLSGALS